MGQPIARKLPSANPVNDVSPGQVEFPQTYNEVLAK
jgi:hypothetical protein